MAGYHILRCLGPGIRPNSVFDRSSGNGIRPAGYSGLSVLKEKTDSSPFQLSVSVISFNFSFGFVPVRASGTLITAGWSVVADICLFFHFVVTFSVLPAITFSVVVVVCRRF